MIDAEILRMNVTCHTVTTITLTRTSNSSDTYLIYAAGADGVCRDVCLRFTAWAAMAHLVAIHRAAGRVGRHRLHLPVLALAPFLHPIARTRPSSGSSSSKRSENTAEFRQQLIQMASSRRDAGWPHLPSFPTHSATELQAPAASVTGAFGGWLCAGTPVWLTVPGHFHG